MPDANFSSRKTSESFTSAFLVQKKVPQIDADVGVVLVQAKLLTNLVADNVVPFLLDIFADVLALQAEGIEAAITDLPVRESLVLQICDELGMALLKDNLGGTEELFPVGHQYVNLFFAATV